MENIPPHLDVAFKFKRDSVPYRFAEIMVANMQQGRDTVTHLELMLQGLEDTEQRQSAGLDFALALERYGSIYSLVRFPGFGYSLEAGPLPEEAFENKRLQLEALWAKQLFSHNLIETACAPLRVGNWSVSRYRLRAGLASDLLPNTYANLLPRSKHGQATPYQVQNTNTGQRVQLLLAPVEGKKLEFLMNSNGYLDRDVIMQAPFSLDRDYARTQKNLFGGLDMINQKYRAAGLVISGSENPDLLTTSNTKVGVTLAGEKFARDNHISGLMDAAAAEGSLQLIGSGYVGESFWELVTPASFLDESGQFKVSLFRQKGIPANVLRITTPGADNEHKVVIMEIGKYLTELFQIFFRAGTHELPYQAVMAEMESCIRVKKVPANTIAVFGSFLDALTAKGAKILTGSGIAVTDRANYDKAKFVLPLLESEGEATTVAAGVLGISLWETLSQSGSPADMLRFSYMDGEVASEAVLKLDANLCRLLTYCIQKQLAVLPLEEALEAVNSTGGVITADELVGQLKGLVYEFRKAGIRINTGMEVLRNRDGLNIALPIPASALAPEPIDHDNEGKFIAKLVALRKLALHFWGMPSATYLETAINRLIGDYVETEFARRTSLWTIKAWRLNNIQKFRQEITERIVAKVEKQLG